MTRAGIVTVVGKPNSGKSTLLNRIIGQKLSIVSPKPQSTRDRVVGIHTAGDTQMVILDTPGLLHPKYALQRAMRSTALHALADADVIVHLVDAAEETLEPLQQAANLTQPPKAPIIVAFNKADLLSPRQRAALSANTPNAMFISARSGEGVAELLAAAGERLPESPFLYPEDEISTQHLRFFVGELIRETALEQLSDEVPYSIACAIEEFREGKIPVYIRAVLHVERDSQKRILIGTKGERIRSIGQSARVKVESLLAQRVFLDLWVKVLPNWRKNTNALARFGYRVQEDGRS
jgi:GTP-binding protein Era